jgi:flagellar biosynthesis/type III secretory pathway protein FliH
LYWLAEATILSDYSKINVDWKLNQLLSASRASKQYVTRVVDDTVAQSLAFAPWVPRQLSTAAKHASGNTKSEADPSASDDTNSAPSPDEHNDKTSLSQPIEDIEPALNMLTDQELLDIRTESFEQGKREAAAELDEQIGETDRRFVALITQLANTSVDLLEVKRSVADLAIFIATQLIRSELSSSTQWLDNLVEQCLEEIRLHGNHQITVSLSEADFEEHQSRLAGRHELVVFISDNSLQPGDIEMSMGATRISERMTEKLSEISQQLLATINAPADNNPEPSEPALTGDIE